jgi:hypothetical protein
MIVVAKGKVLGLEAIEERQSGGEILGQPAGFLLWSRSASKTREIEVVTQVDPVMGVPGFGKIKELLNGLLVNQCTMVVRRDDEPFE